MSEIFILLDTLAWEPIGERFMSILFSFAKPRSTILKILLTMFRFENDRTISFIPPDGEFELMSYRLNTHVKPLIWIESVIERHDHSRIEIMVKAKSQFKRRSTANNVEIMIPVPSDADSPKFKTTIGTYIISYFCL